MEVTIGSHEVKEKMGMGTGFLLKGTGEFLKEGSLFDAMHDKCSFCNRVISIYPGRLSANHLNYTIFSMKKPVQDTKKSGLVPAHFI